MVNEVTETTLRSNSFRSLFTLIDNNKIAGSTVYAGFPNKNPQFPLYAIHPFKTPSKSVTLGDIQDYDLTCEIELWCKAKDLKAKIDEMKDNIQSTILANIDYLKGQNLLLAEDWLDDTNVESVEINDEKFHTGAVLLKFKLK